MEVGICFADQARQRPLGLTFLAPITKNSVPQVESFIESLLQQRNVYLRERYLQLSPLLNYDMQLERLAYLDRAGVINHQEFKDFRKQLDILFKQRPIPIGFHKSSE
jgi:hypothetical protein